MQDNCIGKELYTGRHPARIRLRNTVIRATAVRATTVRATAVCAMALLASGVMSMPVKAQMAPAGARSASGLPEPTLPRKYTGGKTEAKITEEDFMSRIYLFADDSMLGRETGHIGNFKGTEYIAAELKRLGLEPGGENGTYFQKYPYMQLALKTDEATMVTAAGALKPGVDFNPVVGINADFTDIPVIYAGPVDVKSTLAAGQLLGKVVVYGPASAPSSGIGLTPGPSLTLYATTDDKRVADATVSDTDVGRLTRYGVGSSAVITVEAVEKIFGKPLNELVEGESARIARISMEFEKRESKFPPRNVIGIIRGSDPSLKHTYVSIGAHNDHVGLTQNVIDHDSVRILNYMQRPGGAESRPRLMTEERWAEFNEVLAAHRRVTPIKLDSVFNGADDNASGSMAMLEIAEYFQSLKGDARPKRSILFVWHTGEEKGLLGSAYYTDSLKDIAHDSIIANINIDMIGRGFPHDTKDGGDSFLQLVGSRRLSTQLGDIVEEVNKEKGYGFKLDYSLDANGHPAQIYCRSDHASYARYGIPVVFFFTGTHSDYHMLSDEPQYINYPHLTKITRYISDLVLDLSHRAERPQLNGPKPDPSQRCRQ